MRHRYAFTLIELLVVVAIIVALLAILLPSMSGAILSAQRAVCLSNIHQQYLAQVNYAADNSGIFPRRAQPTHSAPNYQRWDGDTLSPATLMRGTYVPDTQVLICPVVANVPRQGSTGTQFSSTDWYVHPWGGWDTQAPRANSAYMWFAAYPMTGVTLLNGTRAFPQRISEMSAARPFITHRLNYYDLDKSHEISHGGRGLGIFGVSPLDDYQTTDMPIGSGDGSGMIHLRGEILPRYSDQGNGTRTFIW